MKSWEAEVAHVDNVEKGNRGELVALIRWKVPMVYLINGDRMGLSRLR